MKKGLLYAVIIVLLTMLNVSCFESEPDSFCDIKVENKTTEDVTVEYRSWTLFFESKHFITMVYSKDEEMVSVPVGRDIYITGNDSDREWGPRKFYYYGNWIVPYSYDH